MLSCLIKGSPTLIVLAKCDPLRGNGEITDIAKPVAKTTKAGAIFPEKINGKYYLLFNEYRTWLASSDDIKNWE